MAYQYDTNPFASPQRKSSPTRSSFPFASGPVPGLSKTPGQGELPADMALKALMAMMPQRGGGGFQPSQFTQSGPVLWERGTGPGGGSSPSTTARQITGGFAPGTVGYIFQDMLPRILESLMGGGGAMGGPSRADLLDPRLADIEDVSGQQERALLNRFASMGRDVTGSVPTEALQRSGERRGIERQRAMGDVDTLLAQLGIQQQNAAMSRFGAIAQIMAALGMGG